jgi:putative lipoprotein (rSAM/lipoprotein system)
MTKTVHCFLIERANWILAGILSILGFPGCHLEKYGLEEYGVPYATFSFRGTVIDEVGKPVKDIKVEVGIDGDVVMDNSVLANTSEGHSYSFSVFRLKIFM